MASWSASLFTRLHRYRNLFYRRWYVLIFCVAAGVAVQAWRTSSEAPTYVSYSRMMISPRISLTETVYREELSNFHGTQLELMRSSEVQQRARARVAARQPELAGAHASLNAFQQPRTNVFVLSSVSGNPVYAQAFLDACMDEFLAMRKESRSGSSEQALAAISEQLVKVEKEIDQTDQELLDFQTKNNVLFLEEQNTAAVARLQNLNEELTAMRNEVRLMNMIDAERSLENARPGEAGRATSQGPSFAEARNQVGMLEIERDRLARYLKPAHPKMQRLNEEIDRQKRLLDMYRRQGLAQIEAERTKLQLRLQNMEKTVQEEEARGLELSQRMGEYQRLKKKLSRSQALYDQLLTGMQSLDLSNNIEQDMVAVQERATVAQRQSSSLPTALIQGAAVGTVIGLLLLFLIDRIDDRINSMTELRDHLDEPVLGQIPYESTATDNSLEALLATDDQRHVYAEAFRNIRSSLLFMPMEGERPRTLLVSSAIPGEGKSTVAANLAITMAFAGARVLLVDADLRRGRLDQVFRVEGHHGLSQALAGSMEWPQTVQATDFQNLWLLPRGPTPSHPGELFLLSSTADMIREMRETFEFVVFDTAPILATDDTTSLAPKIDGTVFVLRTSFTSARLIHNALDSLYQRQATVLGLVLNCVNTHLPEYYYYQYREYYSKPS
jgi:capsular exopolysaccharide synthesis family protein